MDLLLRPGKLHGCVMPPPSKSELMRLILAAALAEGTSVVRPTADSGDLRAALACASALGATWEEYGGGLRIRGTGAQILRERPRFCCGESAAVLRFYLPVSLALCGGGEFLCEGRLPDRPLKPFYDLFDRQGISYAWDGGLLRVSGALRPGEYSLPGDVSSQFFSGLLFALPLLDGPSTLRCDALPESADYLRMTLAVLRRAGIRISEGGDGFSVFPEKYRPLETEAERDWSQAAFWLTAAALGGELRVDGLTEDSLQADRRAPKMIAQLLREGDAEMDFSQNPDLLPPLAVLAALRQGETRLCGAARLRYKESDRLSSVSAMLASLGADVKEYADGLLLRGAAFLRGGTEIDCAGDHRVAMAAAVAAARCKDPIVLHGAECVRKSYPDFWEQYRALGGDFDVVKLG